MATSPRSRLLLLLLVALTGVAGFLVLTADPKAPRVAPVAEPDEEVALPDPLQEAQRPVAPLKPAPEPAAIPARVSAFQLDVNLELVWAAPRGGTEVRAWGSGRTAKLEGRFADARGNGFRAEVTIVGGPNEGRRVQSDDAGVFSMDSLYPGLAIVEVRGPSIPGSRREVLLGRKRTSLLNIGYGRLCVVTGKVADASGIPLADARVVFDGQETFTDEEGIFRFPGVAGGAVLVEVSKRGFASYREKLNLAAGTVVNPDRLRYVLREESSLVLSVKPTPGVDAPVDVYLSPSRATTQNGYPWYRLNPIRLDPGQQRRITGLPDIPIHVRAFQEGRVSAPRIVTLSRGNENTVVLVFEPATSVRGRVLFEGNPIPGARVKFEAPDRTQATLAFFRMPSSVLSTEVLPPLPPAYQETTTNVRGEFRFTTWPDLTSHYYIEARAPDHWDGGELLAGRVVSSKAKEIELVLESADGGDAALVLNAERSVGLRVATRVPGREESEPQVFGPEDVIAVDGLRPGTWRVEVSWQGGVLLEAARVVLNAGEDTVLDLPLPPTMLLR